MCPKCGAVTTAGAAFCTNCGTKLSDNPSPQAAPAAEEATVHLYGVEDLYHPTAAADYTLRDESFKPPYFSPTNPTAFEHIYKTARRPWPPQQFMDIWKATIDEERAHTDCGHYSNADEFSTNLRSLRLIASPTDPVNLDNTRTFLATIARSSPPWLIYSLIATKNSIYQAFTAPKHSLEQLQEQILPYYPNTGFDDHYTCDELRGLKMKLTTWRPEVPLSPIGTVGDFNPDPFAPFFSFVEYQLQPDEAVSLAIAFRPALKARQALLEAYIGLDELYKLAMKGGGIDDPHRVLQPLLDHKLKSEPLWDVDLNTLVFASTDDRLHTLTQHFQQFFDQFTFRYEPLRATYSLKPFSPEDDHPCWEIWLRPVLSTDELAGFVHFPHKSVASRILIRATKRLKPVPDHLTQPPGLSLGENEHFGTTKPVYLPHARRGQHIYVVGASGSGKSAHMCNLMKQDIDEGAGFALLDPHGDLAERVLALIPEERAADVVYFNPTDREHITPLNIFAGAKNPQELVLIADGVIVTFRRLVESWGDRMENILRQTVYTLLAVGNKTFADIQRMLSDPPFREQVVAQLTNPPLKRFWQYDFPNLPKNACDPITNKFSKFLNPLDPTRFIFSLPETKFNFEDIMQGRKIFLANLAQGQLGEDFSQLLGALLVSQFQLSATRRAAIPEEARTPFTLYVDEFQNFTSGDPKSFEKILSEARKYKLQLVLAHQFTSQLPTGVTDAILGNVYTQIVFRVGLKDAALLQRSFTALTPDDLQNLDIGNALTRCGKSEDSFSLKTRNYPNPPATNPSTQIQAHSRDTYSIPVQQAYDHEAEQYKQAAAAAETPADEEILGRT